MSLDLPLISSMLYGLDHVYDAVEKIVGNSLDKVNEAFCRIFGELGPYRFRP